MKTMGLLAERESYSSECMWRMGQKTIALRKTTFSRFSSAQACQENMSSYAKYLIDVISFLENMLVQ